LENAAPQSAPTPIAVAVVEHEGRFLIQQRPVGVPLAGLWEFPGGKVRPGETPEAAAARECLEETGLAVIVGSPYPEVVRQYSHDKVRLSFFRCTLADVPPAASSAYRWVMPGELADYEFPPANSALVAMLASRKA
jgi:8-oxo-dGTP diphosphatase